MKIFCLILSLSVLLLSTVPCCDDNCEEEQVTTEQADNHDESTESCSPFLTCGVCTGFATLYNNLNIEPAEEENSVNTSHSAVLLVENNFATIWQPPKIVNT
ncbi:MAG: DUF6660 family protein [Cyclobacteriaceae bacterium]